jgi:hypothetical protein
MKQKLRTVIVIATVLQGRIQYVSGQSTRYDGKYIPQLSPDIHQAKEYRTTDGANQYMVNISNAMGRVYNVMQIEVAVIPKPESKLGSIAGKLATILIALSIVLVSCYSAREGCPSTDQKKLYKYANRPLKV